MTYILPLNESQRLEKLKSLKILDTDAEQEFDYLTQLAAQICGVPISAVSLIDTDRQWFNICNRIRDERDFTRGCLLRAHD